MWSTSQTKRSRGTFPARKHMDLFECGDSEKAQGKTIGFNFRLPWPVAFLTLVSSCSRIARNRVSMPDLTWKVFTQ